MPRAEPGHGFGVADKRSATTQWPSGDHVADFQIRDGALIVSIDYAGASTEALQRLVETAQAAIAARTGEASEVSDDTNEPIKGMSLIEQNERMRATLVDLRDRALSARDISPAWRATFATIADEALKSVGSAFSK